LNSSSPLEKSFSKGIFSEKEAEAQALAALTFMFLTVNTCADSNNMYHSYRYPKERCWGFILETGTFGATTSLKTSFFPTGLR